MSLETDIKNMVESVGMNLYDTLVTSENDETIFRVNITSQEMKDGKSVGVSMDKCVEVTKLISPLLDVESPVSGEYRLEVSSPGIERKLKSLNHFKNSLGENVKIVLLDKTKIQAVLLSVEGNEISLKTDDEIVKIEFNTIAKASTYFEW